ncbi:ankyrin repeat domain-containing protein [Reichenbachiella carrageenanivorans]|uniref:Ankyrin repeat domain-containing protein n=1 Tax=Reichenbachiella carrageenanivorans TaxID=2979869 RepID=A0ABY6CV01_9BACT|nr:ankyrin repeat domain-containing protein [Reichenbachiella carrageenanivorans]UXX77751.1 ankyrin repeat domain-containing protein [Reichenbachiella carrageenanivorans]
MKNLTDQLYTSVVRNELKKAKNLIAQGGEINVFLDRTGQYMIHSPTQDGNTEMLQLLISHGADLNVKTKPGFTACHLAAMSNNLEALKLLIENGADKDIRDPYGNTLLTTAVASFDGDDSIVKYLLDLGMDPLAENNRGNNLLNGLDMPRKDPIRHLFEKWL